MPTNGPKPPTRLAAALIATCAMSVVPARAQTALPTLEDLGVGWSSSGGYVQLGFSGRADLEFYVPQGQDPPWLIPETDPFVGGRVRLFADLFVGAHLYATAELRADDGEAPEGELAGRLEQLFVRWAPLPAFALQAGRFASPFGSYPQRHHSPDDPLIRPPLQYEWRTMVSAQDLPGNSARFVQWKYAPDRFRPIGAPPVWAAPYQWGAMALGAIGPFTYRAALMNSAPSSEPAEWGWEANPMDAPSWVAGLGFRAAPWLRLEAWYDRGAYIQDDATGPRPAGWDLGDWDQVVWGGGVVARRGYTTVRAEAMHDRWCVPNVEDEPVDVSYSVEAAHQLTPLLFLAARWSAIDFNTIHYQGLNYQGVAVEGDAEWDWDTTRFQLGGGARLLRNVEARAEYMWNRSEGPDAPDDDLLSFQLWYQF